MWVTVMVSAIVSVISRFRIKDRDRISFEFGVGLTLPNPG